MFRAYVYLAAAGAVWFAEGYVFSRQLGLAPWQIVTLAALYVGLYVIAIRALLANLRAGPEANVEGVAAWRLVTLAPMLVVIVGSFLSLALILFVAMLGAL